jgi:hypothetical protein
MHEFLFTRHPFMLQVNTWNIINSSMDSSVRCFPAFQNWLPLNDLGGLAQKIVLTVTGNDMGHSRRTRAIHGGGGHRYANSIRLPMIMPFCQGLESANPTHAPTLPLGSWPGPSVNLVLFPSRATPCKSEPPVFRRINRVCLCTLLTYVGLLACRVLTALQLHSGAELFGNVIVPYSELSSKYHIGA